ncbi:TrmH family RNA methyltransferase [Petrocella sp. FN5]|uniref:TrmH family RNA methyltransferase n=1 Tax=Petrocella sp. FN5 TaxID=3032002 RepID=UPI0023DCB712|nr:RNA methyltransferase [Petrocella sp. FN5]MDF1615944.1 RNA methyltransferase [Petrocella sp. FN5]
MISSRSNPKVKEIQKLQSNQRYRQQSQKFVVEGWRLIKEIPFHQIERIYIQETQLEKLQSIDSSREWDVEQVSDSVMKAMSKETTSQGILAIVYMKPLIVEMSLPDKPLIIALENVQDPGNLGTILRTADAAGVDLVLLSKGTVDLYNPKVVKATMGAIFRMNILKDVDLNSYIENLKEKDVHVFAAHLEGIKNHYEGNYIEGTCFLIGNEGDGLSRDLSSLATDYIKIPMRSEAESLNVAVATSILVYEAVRQRGID